MRIALLMPTRSEAFPVPTVERLEPILRGLAERGHQVVVALRPGQSAPAWVSALSGVEAKQIRRRTGVSRAPRRSSSASRFVHEALRGYAEWLTGLETPESWPHVAGRTADRDRGGWRSVAAALGCDVAVSTSPGDSVDLLVLDGSATNHDGVDVAAMRRAVGRCVEVHALSTQVARNSARFRERSQPDIGLVPWPHDPSVFIPEGNGARAALGLDADQIVCIWIPPSHVPGDPSYALAAFGTLVRDAAQLAGKIHLLLPARSEAESRAFQKLASASLGAAAAHVSSPVANSLKTWADLLSAANVGIACGGLDHVGLTVMDALACGCPVVTQRSNGAAEILQPGASGEVVAAAAKPQVAAEAMARLLATERAQRSRSFVAMAGHLPSVTEAVDAWESSLSRAYERRLLEESGIGTESTTVSAARPATRIDSTRSLKRWIESGFEFLGSGTSEEAALLSAANLRLPEHVSDPIEARVIERDENGFISSHKVPGGGNRDKCFTSAKPANLTLRVFQRDPVEGMRIHRVLHQLSGLGILCPEAVRSGSDGRSSFLVVSEAPGMPLLDFLAFANAGGHESGPLATRLVCAALGATLADIHAADVSLGGLGVDGLRAVIDARGEIRIAIAEPWTLRAVVGAGDAPEAVRDLAWLALSVRRLSELRGDVTGSQPSALPDSAPSQAAAVSDVARAIGAAAYGAPSASQKKEKREVASTPGTPPMIVRDPVSRVAILRVVVEWCARRGKGESLDEILRRVSAVLPTADAARSKATNKRRTQLEVFSRERVRRGDLVPARLDEI